MERAARCCSLPCGSHCDPAADSEAHTFSDLAERRQRSATCYRRGGSGTVEAHRWWFSVLPPLPLCDFYCSQNAHGELWVQDGLLLFMALGLSGFAGYRLYLKNNAEKRLRDAISADERAIDLACRFGYSVPNSYKSLGQREQFEKHEDWLR